MRRCSPQFLAVLAMATLAIVAWQPRVGAGPVPLDRRAATGGAPFLNEQAAADFYQNETVLFIVGFPPGGGLDTYTRAIARHIGRHIPGSPSVVVDNMPGGGSVTAANYVYRASRPDGLTIGAWSGGLVLQQVLGGEGIEFDARRYRFIGIPASESNVCAVRKESGFRSLSELVNGPQPVILGGSAPGAASVDAPRVLGAALGIHFELVLGYSGAAGIRQAADSGEVHGACFGWDAMKLTWGAALEAGDAVVIGQLTAEKLAELPDVEVALDLATTEEAKQLIRSGVIVPGVIQRVYAVHPDTPDDRVQALRQAFMAVFEDPEFIHEAEQGGLDLAPLSGEEVEALVRELFDMPEALKTRLRSILVPS